MTDKVVKFHSSKGPKKWLLWVGISLSVLITGFVLYWRIYKKQQQITKLRTEAELAKADAARKQFEMKHAESTEKFQQLVAEANALSTLAETKRQDILKADKEIESDLAQIKALKAWKDLDAYNKQQR